MGAWCAVFWLFSLKDLGPQPRFFGFALLSIWLLHRRFGLFAATIFQVDAGAGFFLDGRDVGTPTRATVAALGWRGHGREDVCQHP